MAVCLSHENGKCGFLPLSRCLAVISVIAVLLDCGKAEKVEVYTVSELVQAFNDTNVDHIILAARFYNFSDAEIPHKTAVISHGRQVTLEGKEFGDGTLARIDNNQLMDRIHIIEGGQHFHRNFWADDCIVVNYPYLCFSYLYGKGSRAEFRDGILSDAACVKWKQSFAISFLINAARTSKPLSLKTHSLSDREVRIEDTGWVPFYGRGSHWRYVNVTLSCTGNLTHPLPSNMMVIERSWSRKVTTAMGTTLAVLLSVLYWAYSRGYFSAPHEFYIARKRGYDLQAELGQGRFGKVYRAVHRSSGRTVAIKVVNLRPSKWRELQLAWRECQIMSGVRHPSCIRVITYYSHRILPVDVPKGLKRRFSRLTAKVEKNLEPNSALSTPGSTVSSMSSMSNTSSASIARMYLDITAALDTIASEEHNESGARLTAAMLVSNGGSSGVSSASHSAPNSVYSRSPAPDSLTATPDLTLDMLTGSGGSSLSGSSRDGLGGVPLGSIHLQMHLVMEFADQGTLLDAVRVGRFKLPSTALPNLPAIVASLLDVVRGLAVLHHPSRRLVHRDLSPTNVLLVSEFNDRGFRAVLTDFGLTTVVGLGQTHRTSDTRGTLAFMPPELLHDNVVSAGTDIYSMGVLIMFILMDGDPYKGFSPGRMISYKVKAADEQLIIPAELADNEDPLMRGLIRLARWSTRFERKMRPTADEAVELLESLL